MRWLLSLCVLSLLVGPVRAQTARPKDDAATFTLKEVFGVHHPDQIAVFDLDKPVDATNCYMLAPDGAEVPYQVLDGGRKIAVRTSLPASRMAMRCRLGYTCEWWAKNYKFDTKGVENMLTTDGPCFTSGDVVQVDGAVLPEGLSRNTNYFVTKLEFRGTRGWGSYFIGLARTPGGPAIAIAKSGENVELISQAMVADPDTNQLYVHAHQLGNGTPVKFRSLGDMPQPLRAGVVYYVCRATADRFSVSGRRGGKPIDLLTPGSGIHKLLIDWTWTLKSGRAPNPLNGRREGDAASEDQSVGDHQRQVRHPPADVPASRRSAEGAFPVQGVRLADGTWIAAGPQTIAFTPGTQVKKVAVNLVENGPLKAVAEVAYELDRAVQLRPNGRLPGRSRQIHLAIEVQAGQPSVLFEEDTDCQFSYAIDLQGLTLNQRTTADIPCATTGMAGARTARRSKADHRRLLRSAVGQELFLQLRDKPA